MRVALIPLALQVPCDTLSARSRYDIQAVELAVIGATRPYNLTVVAGGFRHIPVRQNFHPTALSSLATVGPTPSNTSAGNICNLLDTHVVQSIEWSKTLPPDICHQFIHPESAKGTLRQLRSFNLRLDRVASIQVSSDVTLEALMYQGHGLEYTGINVGPGPSFSWRSRMRALRMDDAEIERAYEASRVPVLVSPFTDIFPTTTPHEWLWLAILDLVKLIRLLKPTIIRAEGAESARILMTDIAADLIPSNYTTAQSRMLDSFFGQNYQGSALALGSVVRPSATLLRFEMLPPPDFLSWIGDVVIAQVGPDPVADSAIIIANVSLLVSGC